MGVYLPSCYHPDMSTTDISECFVAGANVQSQCFCIACHPRGLELRRECSFKVTVLFMSSLQCKGFKHSRVENLAILQVALREWVNAQYPCNMSNLPALFISCAFKMQSHRISFVPKTVVDEI